MGDKLVDNDKEGVYEEVYEKAPSDKVINVNDPESKQCDDEENPSKNPCSNFDCSLGLGCCFWTHSCQLCCGCLPSINRKFDFCHKNN